MSTIDSEGWVVETRTGSPLPLSHEERAHRQRIAVYARDLALSQWASVTHVTVAVLYLLVVLWWVVRL